MNLIMDLRRNTNYHIHNISKIGGNFLMPHLINSPPHNIRVTYDNDHNNAKSESSISINPLNPYNMIAGSKRFTNPSMYEFTLGICTTFDGGQYGLNHLYNFHQARQVLLIQL
jgi:hypothetical protein